MSEVEAESAFDIRSRYGFVRDLIPIYSWYQVPFNIAAVIFASWLVYRFGDLYPLLIFGMMFGWVVQFTSRPSLMPVSQEQAIWLKRRLELEGLYRLPEGRDQWRANVESWWWRPPHNSIEFLPGNPVTIIAPRNMMESVREELESALMRGEVSSDPEAPLLETLPPEPERSLPWHMNLPSAGLAGTCAVLWLWLIITNGSQGAINWGVSAAAISEGRLETIVLHMFAHGGGMHLGMNVSALLAIGPTLTARLGRPPLNWLRFFAIFFFSGLGGAAVYLLLHPAGTVPMVGASGGLYGLLALLIRVPAAGDDLLSLKSVKVRRVGWRLVKENAFLFAMLALLSWGSGGAGGLAWEAHLGGFLFGFFVGPRFLPRPTPISSITPAAPLSSPELTKA